MRGISLKSHVGQLKFRVQIELSLFYTASGMRKIASYLK